MCVRKLAILCSLDVACLFLTFACGCAGRTTPESKIRVSPCEFFRRDLRILEPHLGLRAACVKLQYSFTRPADLRIVIDEWRDGKVKHGGVKTELPSRFDGEISFSLREELNNEGKPGLRAVMAWDRSADYFIPKPPLKDSTILSRLVKNAIDANQGEEVPVPVGIKEEASGKQHQLAQPRRRQFLAR